MSCVLESLERRTLFAISVPINVQFAYDATVVDAQDLNAGVKAAAKAVAADKKALTAEVKALGNTPANKALLHQVEVAGSKMVSNLSAATSRYLNVASPANKRMETAASLFADYATTGYATRLAAAQAALQAIQAKQYAALVSVVTGGTAGYATELAALAAANPTATTLVTDVQASSNTQSTLSTTEDALVTQVQTDAATLVNVE